MHKPFFALEDVSTAYGESNVLHNVSLSIEQGDAVSLIGRNGVGKTTTLRSITNIVTPYSGRIIFAEEDIVGKPTHEITSRGISYVPEERQIFPDLTVDENLRMGSIRSDNGLLTLEETFEWFPRLEERRAQQAASLSGGEQQMLAIARAILGETKLLLLDEPTEGLAPQIVTDVINILENLQSATDVTILLIEQDLRVALTVANRHHVMDKGRVVFEGSTDELEEATDVKQRHLSVGADPTE